MRAVWYEALGEAHKVLQYGERPTPEPGDGEVRVKIAVSGVNPSDVKRRAGRNQTMAYRWAVPDQDGAGRIDRVGPGVDPARVGERVWLHSTAWKRQIGTAAEYTTTPAFRAVPLAESISYTIGAGLGVPAMTAHRALFGCGPVCDRTVMITGGAGAVGFYAIALAKWAGARVIATTSSEAKAADATRAGADHVIDYKREKVAERVAVLTGGRGVDHIVEVDFGANVAASVASLASGGSIAAYASMAAPEPAIPFYTMMFKNLRMLWVHVYEMSREAIDAATHDVGAWLASGRAVHPAYHRFPLERTADAHVAVERAAVGKVVIDVGGESV